MRDFKLENLYSEQIVKANSPLERHHITKYNLIVEKYSNKELAAIIAAQDEKLEPAKSMSKDVRVQPIEGFDRDKFEDVLSKANLTILAKLLPGQEYGSGLRSTSGQFYTYIVSDEGNNKYPVVLGKGTGSTLRAESLALKHIEQQIESILLQTEEDFFYIKVKDDKIKVDGVENVKGHPKSDFNFIYKNKPTIFVSHKDGKSPKDFQQWGGVTCRAGTGICEHGEVEDLIDVLKSRYPSGMSSGQHFTKEIKSEDLKLMSMYGPDYGEGFGEDNVHVVLQGTVTIKETEEENTYKLEAPHVMYNGYLPESGSDYDPVFYVRFSGSRTGNFGIKNARIMIRPRGAVKAKLEEIKNLKRNIDALSKSEEDFAAKLKELF